MDRCSYFIKDRALFGSYPTQEAIDELEANGVRYFVNLTFNHEKKIVPYTTRYTSINYPIPDHRVPPDWNDFAKFIIHIAQIISTLVVNQRLYIHCKGGHGRSGVVVACILCFIENILPYEALRRTTRYHSNRSVMRDKWRRLGSPQTKAQKNFVHRFFEPLYFYRVYRSGPTLGFPNFSLHSVYVPGLGTFPTAEAAFQAYKDPTNKDYVHKQETAENPVISKYLGNRCDLRYDWEGVKNIIMDKVLTLKFDQHPELKEKLLNTGFRPLIEHNKADDYWGDGPIGFGKNMFGKLLSKLRHRYYEEDLRS